MLMGLLLPAVQASREYARRTQCMHHLRQIGVALHARHDVMRRFPAGWQTLPGRTTAIGWAAQILPQLERPELHQLIDRRVAIDSPANAAARAAGLPAMRCPSDVSRDQFAIYRELGHETSGQTSSDVLVELPAANYVGVFGSGDPDAGPSMPGKGAFIKDHEATIAEVYRGLAHVIFVGERTARKLPATWLGIHLAGEDAAGRVTGQACIGPNRNDADECEYDSRHPGGVNFEWGDGHVAWLNDEVDPELYRRLANLRD